MKKFEVIFYEDDRGNCPIAVWLRSLDRENSKSSLIGQPLSSFTLFS